MTIAQQLKIKDFPFIIEDKDGNSIYYEDSIGFWCKTEWDTHGNEIYYEDSDDYWRKREYDEHGNEIYCENSDGVILDNRPNLQNKTIDDLTSELAEARGALDVEIKHHMETTAKWNGCHMDLTIVLCDLNQARRERDEARDEMIRWQSIAEGRGRTDDDTSVCQELNDANERMGKKLAQTLDERDRLAEALHDLVASCNCIDSVDFMPVSMPEAFEKAQQALQSLTPNV